jgi:hypothetical protein
VTTKSSFFSCLEDLLNDRYDSLWGSAYDGWDSANHRFAVERREGENRWWHRLLNIDTTRLELVVAEPDTRSDSSERAIRRYLEALAKSGVKKKSVAEAKGIASLIRVGLELEKSL